MKSIATYQSFLIYALIVATCIALAIIVYAEEVAIVVTDESATGVDPLIETLPTPSEEMSSSTEEQGSPTETETLPQEAPADLPEMAPPSLDTEAEARGAPEVVEANIESDVVADSVPLEPLDDAPSIFPFDFLQPTELELENQLKTGSPESPFDCIRGMFREWAIGFENPGECLAYVRERAE